MAEQEEDRSKRSAGAVPYGLLSPGVLWLLLFFLVPLVTLARTSLSVKHSRFDPNDIEFTWHVSTYTNAISEYSEQFARSFVYAGLATLLCIVILLDRLTAPLLLVLGQGLVGHG